jgi:hypothetical protein
VTAVAAAVMRGIACAFQVDIARRRQFDILTADERAACGDVAIHRLAVGILFAAAGSDHDDIVSCGQSAARVLRSGIFRLALGAAAADAGSDLDGTLALGGRLAVAGSQRRLGAVEGGKLSRLPFDRV